MKRSTFVGLKTGWRSNEWNPIVRPYPQNKTVHISGVTATSSSTATSAAPAVKLQQPLRPFMLRENSICLSVLITGSQTVGLQKCGKLKFTYIIIHHHISIQHKSKLTLRKLDIYLDRPWSKWQLVSNWGLFTPNKSQWNKPWLLTS